MSANVVYTVDSVIEVMTDEELDIFIERAKHAKARRQQEKFEAAKQKITQAFSEFNELGGTILVDFGNDERYVLSLDRSSFNIDDFVFKI